MIRIIMSAIVEIPTDFSLTSSTDISDSLQGNSIQRTYFNIKLCSFFWSIISIFLLASLAGLQNLSFDRKVEELVLYRNYKNGSMIRNTIIK